MQSLTTILSSDIFKTLLFDAGPGRGLVLVPGPGKVLCLVLVPAKV